MTFSLFYSLTLFVVLLCFVYSSLSVHSFAVSLRFSHSSVTLAVFFARHFAGVLFTFKCVSAGVRRQRHQKSRRRRLNEKTTKTKEKRVFAFIFHSQFSVSCAIHTFMEFSNSFCIFFLLFFVRWFILFMIIFFLIFAWRFIYNYFTFFAFFLNYSSYFFFIAASTSI